MFFFYNKEHSRTPHAPTPTCKTRLTLAGVRFYTIHTCGIILTFNFAQTIIDISLATRACIARRTMTAEPSLFEYRACGIVAARIAIACIDHEFTMFAMVTGEAEALVVTLW